MTDPNAPAEPAAASAPAPDPPPPTRTWGSILEEIRDKTEGLDDDQNEQVISLRWYGKDFRLGERSPLNPKYLAFSAYQDESEIRIYEAIQEADQASFPTRRITLSKTGDVMVVEGMNVPRMIDMIVQEIHVKALGVSPAEAERDAILEFLGNPALVHPATSVALVRKLIEDQKHLEDDDDPPAPPNGAAS